MIKPKNGKPLTKTVNGKTYQFCHKCHRGERFWTVGKKYHNTAEHNPSKSAFNQARRNKKDKRAKENSNNDDNDNSSKAVKGMAVTNLDIDTLEFGFPGLASHYEVKDPNTNFECIPCDSDDFIDEFIDNNDQVLKDSGGHY